MDWLEEKAEEKFVLHISNYATHNYPTTLTKNKGMQDCSHTP